VDTGLGRFDHHHTNERTCAAHLVFEHLKKENKIRKKDLSALERLTELVIQVDHFEDFNWSDPASDRYDFSLHHLLDHLKLSGKLNDKELSFQGFSLLDAVLYGLRFKIQAEEELKKGTQFQSYLGRSIGVETKISRVSKLGQKMGYALVVRKEPETHFVSIKSQPLPELDLTKAFEALKKGDPNADWYFHPSKHIILNGSRHNAKVKPSHLSISDLISIIKNC
jgi:hypothetical protein